MQKVVVLGAGRVGAAMAIDLDKKFEVVSADYNQGALNQLNEYKNIKTFKTDLFIPENINKVISDCDLVVSAVPGFMGYETLKAIIKAKKNVVDIAFFPEDPFDLDELAKKKWCNCCY